MTLLLALFFARPAAALDIFVLDDGDSNANDLLSELEDWGHTVTSSQDTFGFTESDFSSSSGVSLGDFDAVIWLDGGSDSSEQMSSSGQAALYSYVSGGGGLLLFGATGYQAGASGYYSSYLSLIPLRSSTYLFDRTWSVTDADHPTTQGFASSFSPSGGVIADSTSSFGTNVFSFTYYSTTYVGGVAASVGSGRVFQSALWGNTTWFYSGYEVDWTDDEVSLMVENAIQWLVQRPPEVEMPDSYTVAAEGTVLMTVGSASDPDGGEVRISWDIGDDGTEDCSGTTCSFTAAGYDGPQSLDAIVTVYDDEGDTTEVPVEITITNVDPVIARVVAASSVDEGSSTSLTVEYSDVEAADTHTVEWSFGDGETDSGSTVTHSWRNDASYSVRVVVTDDDGGVAASTTSITVANVAPTLSGEPDSIAIVDELYTFTPGVSDPGLADVHTYGGTLPDGASISVLTGLVRWTPSRDQVGAHTLRITVDDGDGGTDELEWEVDVQLADRDGDGMPDEWEEDFGLDPDDPADADLDLDGDGRTSLEEYDGDSDPTVYEGPGVPELLLPADGERVSSSAPTFTVGNADAPLGQALTHGFDIYADEALTTRVGGTEGVATGEGETSWTWTDRGLSENTDYWWTSWAADAYVVGAEASPPFRFFVNEVNEAPGAPTVITPFEGAVVETLSPELALAEATDPDRDTLSYRISLLSSAGEEIDGTSGLSATAGEVRFTTARALVDGETYCWYGEAMDPGGLTGPTSDRACFTVDLENDPPSSPLILSPADGGVLTDPLPEITVENGVDPEGRPTVHEFQLDAAPTFDSVSLQTATVSSGEGGTTAWTPTIALSEDQTWFVRVRCFDGAEYSDWAQASFSYGSGGSEGAPTVPTLISPADGSEVESDLTFLVGAALDPEGDALSYEILVVDRSGAVVRSESGLVEGEDGQIDWAPEPLDAGVYSWTARAVDASGLTSSWASSWAFAVGSSGEGLEPDEETSKETGCACSSAAPPGPAAGAWGLLGLVLLAWRRRGEGRP